MFYFVFQEREHSVCVSDPDAQDETRLVYGLPHRQTRSRFVLKPTGLYGVRHMVKDHSYSEKQNPLPPHRLLLSIDSKGSFYMHQPTDRITHTTAFVTPVVEHWLEQEIAQWVKPHKGSIRRPIAP